ncbi:hypothetical protein [Lentibacillus sp.]|uniref:hypothetical protein n=1 Tax=Lentibacillus sp. TaxID=1925746 RepID=UPI002B4B7E57|nr:hypothetical protein [Lentibacillus sp.]HLS08239.1 hypothetical protein [Lentibacillus sp.]
MQHYAILRLLSSGFFLYIAWPVIPTAVTPEAVLFWGAWLGFLILVVGANFATLLQMTEPPVMEQDRTRSRQQA